MPFSTEQHVSHPDDFTESRVWHARAQAEGPRIANEQMPPELIAATALVQRACAQVRVPQSNAQVYNNALHVAASVGIVHNLLPALDGLRDELMAKAEWCQQADHIEAAREITDHLAQLAQAREAIERALPAAHRLHMPDGKSAGLAEQVIQNLAQTLDLPFVPSPDKLAAHISLDTLLTLHGGLKSTALALMKIATDMGKRATSANTPITQCDALNMVCCQVMGNDVSLTIGAAAGQFEGRNFRPLMAQNLLQSIRLLTDATAVFTEFFVRSALINHERISHGLASSLMLVTSRVSQG